MDEQLIPLTPGESWTAVYTDPDLDPEAKEVEFLWFLPVYSVVMQVCVGSKSVISAGASPATIETLVYGIVPAGQQFAPASSFPGFLCYVPSYMVDDPAQVNRLVATIKVVTGKTVKAHDDPSDSGPEPGETSH